MQRYVVRRGDCTSSIAARTGVPWREVWEHPENRALRDLRAEPNLLAEGDVVVVPDRELKVVDGATGRRHAFVVNIPKTYLRLKLVLDGEPVASEPYELELGRQTISGQTDGDGQLEELVVATVSRATLTLGRRNERIELRLGELGPPDTAAGAIARLHNLGLLPSRIALRSAPRAEPAPLPPELCSLLMLVQRAEGLECTGELDSETADALVRMHGC